MRRKGSPGAGAWSGRCNSCVSTYGANSCNVLVSPKFDAARDDLMSTGFVPSEISWPLVVNVTHIAGEDFRPSTICPPEDPDAKSASCLLWSVKPCQTLDLTMPSAIIIWELMWLTARASQEVVSGRLSFHVQSSCQFVASLGRHGKHLQWRISLLHSQPCQASNPACLATGQDMIDMTRMGMAWPTMGDHQLWPGLAHLLALVLAHLLAHMSLL